MKTALFRITMTGVMTLALLAASEIARAQEPLVVDIPFAFMAGKITLPAGEYRVQNPGLASSPVLIQRTDGSAATYVMPHAVQANRPQTQSKLIFRCYGGRYFLSQVWIEGHSRGKELAPSAKEKEQALLARNQAPEQVTIVARLLAPKP